MDSDAVVMDQEQPEQSRSLAQLFASADSAIERRKTDNIFKQLDERSLTEDEERIIQQRVQLQRQLLQQYEQRELTRKVSELQEMWPDLSEAAATRALELCNGKEEEAVLRLTEDAAFKRRVMQETGTHTPTMIVVAAKQARTRGASSGSSRSTNTRIISPSQMGGRVFVGRFRSKLGPYQVMDPALQAALPAGSSGVSPAAAAAAPAQQPKKRGRKRKSELAAIAAAAGSAGTAAAAATAGPPLSEAAAAEAAAAAAQPSDVMTALAAASALSGKADGDPASAAAAAAAADEAGPSSKRQRSSSPCSDDAAAAAAEDESDAATETEPEVEDDEAAGAAGVCSDSGADTDAGAQQGRQQDQQQGQQLLVHADRVISMMARQVARLEPLVAAGRLLEFESRRPSSSPSVLELLAAEYGEQVSVPIATAWEVLLEEQKLNATLGYHPALAGSTAPAAATSSRAALSAASTGEQHNTAAGSVSSPRRSRSRRQADVQILPAVTEQQQQQQQAQDEVLYQPAAGNAACAEAAALASAAALAAAAPACSDTSTISAQEGGDDLSYDPAAVAAAVAAVTAAAAAAATAAAAGTPTSAPAPSYDAAAEAAAGEGEDGAGSSGRGLRAAAVAAAAVSAAAAAEAGSSKGRGRGKSGGGKGNGGGGSRAASRAISETGHTCRGRVRQKSHKTTELVEVGELVVGKDWFNAGYIFPAGFKSRLLFRSSVDTDALCLHECEIIGEGGKFWPSPTFMVTARDREDEPVMAKSCTGCWSQILKRINATIAQRIAAGENLPPPPRTAIAGPEYFGLNDLTTIAAIESLDPEHLCTTYWVGKEQREAASAGLPVAVQPLARGNSSGGASSRGGGSGARKRGRPRSADMADGDDEGEEGYKGNHWSSISRRERYLKRCTEAGDEVPVDAEHNLLPGVLDPVTLEPVVNPAISPAGHVMGLATWKAVLSETGRCPFTKAPLRPDMLTVLTTLNIEKHRARIVNMA